MSVKDSLKSIMLVPLVVTFILAGGSSLLSASVQHHALRIDAEPSRGRLRNIDRVTLVHPGGADSTVRLYFLNKVRFFKASWKEHHLPSKETPIGQNQLMVEVALPYQSISGNVELALYYDYELTSEKTLDDRERDKFIVIEKISDCLPELRVTREESVTEVPLVSTVLDSLSVRLPAGFDLVATLAPLARAQGDRGSTLVKFPEIESPDRFSLIGGRWVTETIRYPNFQLEVSSADGRDAGRGLNAIKRICSTLYGEERTVPISEKGVQASVLSLSGVIPSTKFTSHSFVLDSFWKLPDTDFQGLSVIRPTEAGLTIPSSLMYEGIFDLIWNNFVGWEDSAAAATLRMGLVEYSIFGLIQDAGKMRQFEQRLINIENVVGKNRPVEKWKRWRGHSVPLKERGFGFYYMLSALVGHESMGKILSDFLNTASTRQVPAPEYFQEVVLRLGGQKYDWLFTQYLIDGFLPDFTVEEAKIEELRRPVNLLYDHYGKPSDSGRYTTEVRIGQLGPVKFRGKVDLIIETDTQKYDSEVLFDSSRQTIKIVTASPPRKVILDPHSRFFDSRKSNNTLNMKSLKG
jgi:hypothetical protein